MVDYELEHSDHNRNQDQPRNDKEKDHYTDEEEEEVEILPKHIAKCHKDKETSKGHGNPGQ